MKPTLGIGYLAAKIPIEPSSKAARKRGEMYELKLEIFDHFIRVWGEEWCGDHYDLAPGREHLFDHISKLSCLDLVFGCLAEQYAAHRLDPIGEFLVPVVSAMESAIASRDGSSVYFAEAAGQIKIGWSRKVASRLAQLQTGCASPIKLLGTMPGSRSTERRLHERFAHLRLTGEWFTAAPDLLAFIADPQP